MRLHLSRNTFWHQNVDLLEEATSTSSITTIPIDQHFPLISQKHNRNAEYPE
jgi:hypothetical protein